MTAPPSTPCTAFAGTRRIASGPLRQVAVKAKEVLDRDPWAQVLIFDDSTSALVEVDFRGTAEDVDRRLAEPPPGTQQGTQPGTDADLSPAAARRPGRPKLGVVAREVTLLPRHWEWLAAQPGGASVALRKLVEQARRADPGREIRRRAQEAAYRFLTAMAGNEPGFEEAIRALFAGKRVRFEEMSEPWPEDVRDHALKLAAVAFVPVEAWSGQ